MLNAANDIKWHHYNKNSKRNNLTVKVTKKRIFKGSVKFWTPCRVDVIYGVRDTCVHTHARCMGSKQCIFVSCMW